MLAHWLLAPPRAQVEVFSNGPHLAPVDPQVTPGGLNFAASVPIQVLQGSRRANGSVAGIRSRRREFEQRPGRPV